MAKSKLYANRLWLYKRYCVDRKTVEEIAKETGTRKQTIYNYLKKFGLMR